MELFRSDSEGRRCLKGNPNRSRAIKKESRQMNLYVAI